MGKPKRSFRGTFLKLMRKWWESLIYLSLPLILKGIKTWREKNSLDLYNLGSGGEIIVIGMALCWLVRGYAAELPAKESEAAKFLITLNLVYMIIGAVLAYGAFPDVASDADSITNMMPNLVYIIMIAILHWILIILLAL